MLIASALLLATVVPNAQSVGDRVNALLTEFRTILALDRDAQQTERLEALATALENAVRLDRRAPSPIAPTLDFLDQRVFVHAQLLVRSSEQGGEALVEHARFLVWAERELNPNAMNLGPSKEPRAADIDQVEARRALRAKYRDVFIDAVLQLATALDRQGRKADALAALQQAEQRMGDIPGAVDRIRAALKRLKLELTSACVPQASRRSPMELCELCANRVVPSVTF